VKERESVCMCVVFAYIMAVSDFGFTRVLCVRKSERERERESVCVAFDYIMAVSD